jgi:hypothetical protein
MAAPLRNATTSNRDMMENTEYQFWATNGAFFHTLPYEPPIDTSSDTDAENEISANTNMKIQGMGERSQDFISNWEKVVNMVVV